MQPFTLSLQAINKPIFLLISSLTKPIFLLLWTMNHFFLDSPFPFASKFRLTAAELEFRLGTRVWVWGPGPMVLQGHGYGSNVLSVSGIRRRVSSHDPLLVCAESAKGSGSAVFGDMSQSGYLQMASSIRTVLVDRSVVPVIRLDELLQSHGWTACPRGTCLAIKGALNEAIAFR